MLAWGEKHHSGIPRVKSYACPECGWDWLLERGDIQDGSIVGWNPIPPEPSNTKDAGMVIIECPRCFEKFWFHLEVFCLDIAVELGTLVHRKETVL